MALFPTTDLGGNVTTKIASASQTAAGAALATVVGVLIEVPVMLSVVRIVNRTRGWYERPMASTGAGKQTAA